MKIEISGGDPATQKAVQGKLAGRGFKAETDGASQKTGRHTPGPLDIGQPSGHLYSRTTGKHVATVNQKPLIFGAPWLPEEVEAAANAERLALAWNCHDELLNMLQRMVDETSDRQSVPCLLTMEHARAAIAKAIGGAA